VVQEDGGRKWKRLVICTL